MNLHSDTPAGLRRAALALHALGPADRDWLLARLPPQPRQMLEGLLVELGELGIPPDGDIIRGALGESSHAEPIPADDARSLCLVLAEETGAMQSLLLAALPAPQRNTVLAYWPHDLLDRPSVVVKPDWSTALQEAVLQTWRELACVPGAAS